MQSTPKDAVNRRDPSTSLRMTVVVIGTTIVAIGITVITNTPESPSGPQGRTTIIQKDPDPTFAINQGPFIDAIISRKREHMSERQRVVRALEIIVSMGPIAKVGSGSIRTQRSAWLPKVNLRSLVAALCRDDRNG